MYFSQYFKSTLWMSILFACLPCDMLTMNSVFVSGSLQKPRPAGTRLCICRLERGHAAVWAWDWPSWRLKWLCFTFLGGLTWWPARTLRFVIVKLKNCSCSMHEDSVLHKSGGFLRQGLYFLFMPHRFLWSWSHTPPSDPRMGFWSKSPRGRILRMSSDGVLVVSWIVRF